MRKLHKSRPNCPTCWMNPLLLLAHLVFLGGTGVQSLDNGLGLVPPMGWNSWNTFACNITETIFLDMAHTMIDLDLPSFGYEYINLDDCWMSHNRSASTGKYVGDPERFSHGMKWLGDQVHNMNLKFGIYTSAGTKTCAGFPASLGMEALDALTFAEFGVDYLKYDNCYSQGIPSIDRYTTMRDALNKTGRPIFYSLCQWGAEDSWQWGASVGNAWRTTGDISPSWASVASNFWQSQKHAAFGGTPGAWLDPDMLEVGHAGLTLDESKSHFALWCFAKAPLLLGNDIRAMSPEILAVITNKELIAINQDPKAGMALCRVGCDQTTADYSIFSTSLSDGSTAALIVNWQDSPVPLHTLSGQDDLGIVPNPATEDVVMTDLWTNTTIDMYDFDSLKRVPIPYPLPGHGCLVYRFAVVPRSRTAQIQKEVA